MKLKLKEEPREWRKFLLVMVLMLDGLATVLLWRGVFPAALYAGAQPALALILAAGLARPGWFRGFYRAGMTASFRVGKVTGWVLLTAFFFAVLTPLGLLLRLAGRDLLSLRRRPAEESYWQKCRPPTPFERMF